MRKASLFSVAFMVACLGFAPVCPAAGFLGKSTAPSAAAPAESSGFTASMKRGAAKAKNIMKPSKQAKPAPLAEKTAKASPELFVSMAQLQEKSGNSKAAVLQYEKALAISPIRLGALMGFAHLHDREGRLEEATKYYEKVTLHHPGEAAAYNDLGLCYARRGMLDKSVQSLTKATELSPKKPLYRNNIATVLVEQKRIDEALRHMRAVHPEVVACYNVGFLLKQKGDNEAAKAHFAMALSKDANFGPARDALARLGVSRETTIVSASDVPPTAERPPLPPAMTSSRITPQARPTHVAPVATPGYPARNSRQAAAPAGNYPLRYPRQSAMTEPSASAQIAPLPQSHEPSPGSSEEGPALRLLPAVN